MAELDVNVEQAVKLILDSPTKAVLYVTGGASHTSAWLLSVPGASSTILECRVPYNQRSFIETVGHEAAASLKSFATIDSARTLAKAAYQRAVKLSSPGARVCGIAATCALVSVAPKKGDHRACVATHSNNRVAEYQLQLLKGHRSRWEEEILTSRLVLQALLDDCGMASSKLATTAQQASLDVLAVSRESGMSLVRDLLVEGDILHTPQVKELADPIESLLSGDIRFAEYSNGNINRDATAANLIFPGSFNPLHYGHTSLLEVAKRMCPEHHAAYEISVTNPDKPPLQPDVVRSRLEQFSPEDIVLLTSAPLFTKKAPLFPNSKFVIGVDTALRIVAPKYYGGEANMIAELIELRRKGCSFLVAGRLDQRKDTSQQFLTLSDVQVPTGLEDLFEAIPVSTFRADISSSEIRRRTGRS